ncbi:MULTISPECIES: sn-glycerol-3-phosphate import ATP-binding protein UgpC [unclassified Ruegeria]|uniref:sn-glycerol-3-phosphate import ATP-binding protein UgpC n=1 Tax=unclassified Ruegeria TaxID=2625375 RepID=UPI001AD9CD4A|nr:MULTISPECIES: sn-glycerol-3-phosphate import ATP-binding protein UgpC [unclassified Ruegeria]MBO9412635.1 sn-glycerol-3-phosphate import ATP-binding protein UgpC [Ruegeria sp. R8_1]MBO9416127.1 sn-glycerol-3-phosphate import ATP-binding protein UgpC [Ruegeria sp. R8_2]
MATVTLQDVKKSFGPTDVIHGIDMEIEDGEFIVIVGPSGCGKSTLLRMVAGLETVTSGEIRIGGERANEKEPMDRDIAMVFQNYALYPHMSVRQNMGYGLKIARLPKAQIDQKVTEAAKLLQLEPLLDRKPRQLSGGQRQRVAMGRAIVREPAVFLFDEPLSNLDAKLRVQMRLEIRELQEKLGITSLYVTHDQVEAMTMADRMIVMNGGVAEQIGTPLEVYETPKTLFAAQFIGSPAMNVFDAQRENGLIRVGASEIGPSQGPNTALKLGIRPEHLIVDENGPFETAVQMAEPLGANTLLHGHLAGSGAMITVSLPGVHPIEGRHPSIRFSVAPEHMHFFDSKTGRRLDS